MSELFTRYIRRPPKIQEERQVGPSITVGSKAEAPGTRAFLAFQPPLEVADAATCYVARLDLPGVRPEDVEITAQGREVVIAGKRDPESDLEGKWRGERRFGPFTRTLTLPEPVDASRVEATLQSGVLTLSIPKLLLKPLRKIRVGHRRRFVPFGP